MGLQNFIVQDDRKINNKILFVLEKFKQVDNRLTLVQTIFSRVNFKKLTKKELKKLTPTAKDLLHFIKEFGKLHSVGDEVSVYFLEDQIRKTEADTCGVFQLYFY